MFQFFGHEVCESLAPQPGVKLTTSALEGKVLNTVLPGKVPQIFFNKKQEKIHAVSASRETWFWILALLLTSCVVLNKSLNSPEC